MIDPKDENMNFLTDNPALYEARFPDPFHKAGRFLEEALGILLGDGCHKILDLGCGTGRDLGYLKTLGHRCEGIDSSEPMINYANQHHGDINFRVANMRSFSVENRVDAITCMDSAFLYMHSNEDILSCLTSISNALRPGGVFIAEMRNASYYLGHKRNLSETVSGSFTTEGDSFISETTLDIDSRRQLLTRKRVWHGSALKTQLVQHSAWRLLFPQEIQLFLASAKLVPEAIFDGPGPNTSPTWKAGSLPSIDALNTKPLVGSRIHIFARKPHL